MYRTTGSVRREIGMRSGPYTGGAVLLPWDAIDLPTRRKLLRAHTIAVENRRADTRGLLGLAAACGFVLVILSGSGFGQLSNAWLRQSGWFVLTYGLLLAGIVVPSVWLVRRMFSRHSWLPFERALLPLDAIEATRKGLIVRPFGDARFASITDGVFEIAYADTSTFRIHLDPTVDERQLVEAETTLERASLTTDEAYRASVDPFHDLRGEKGLRTHPKAIPLEPRTAGNTRANEMAAVAMVIASFALAAFLVELRNRMSDDAAFAYARSQNARVHYEAYLDSGGTRHAREVHDDLLPRIVLDEAKAHADADAIGAFLTRFPGSRFDEEAHAALASTCTFVGEGYLTSSRNDLFEDLRRFEREHPVCAYERESLSARWFIAKRKALQGDVELEPGLREAFISLLGRAEHTGKLVPLEVAIRSGTLGDSDQWALKNGLRALLGPVIDPKIGSSALPGGDWIEIRLVTMPCSPGFHPALGAMLVWFQVWHDELQRVSWWRHAKSGNDLFAAMTTNKEPTTESLCVPVMPMGQPTFSP